MKKSIFTIGYGDRNFNNFIEILITNNIEIIIDVRSVPYSKAYPQYNKEVFSLGLSKYNIKYFSYSLELGARRNEKDLYTVIKYFDGKIIEYVDFFKVWENKLFLNAVEKINDFIMLGHRVCLLCSEINPFDCHRGVMIAEFFNLKQNYNIEHILDCNQSVEHKHFEQDYFDFFMKQKKYFIEKNKNNIIFEGGLFKNSMLEDKNFEFWKQFFSSYSYEKGIKLRNIKIGYKQKENDYD